jgi:hypothetical protein
VSCFKNNNQSILQKEITDQSYLLLHFILNIGLILAFIAENEEYNLLLKNLETLCKQIQ